MKPKKTNIIVRNANDFKNYVDYVAELEQQCKKQKEVLDKLKECIKNFLCTEEYINVNGIAIADNYAEVLEILKEVE